MTAYEPDISSDEVYVLLKGLGYNRKESAVVTYFCRAYQKDPKSLHSSLMVEKAADLRQPEASIALNWLVERGCLETEKKLKEGKGAPLKLFRLTVEPKVMVEDMINTRQLEIEKAEKNMKKLLTLILKK